MALKDYITALNRAVLFRFCMRCGAFLGLKDGQGVTGISHGVCPHCLQEMLNNK